MMRWIKTMGYYQTAFTLALILAWLLNRAYNTYGPWGFAIALSFTISVVWGSIIYSLEHHEEKGTTSDPEPGAVGSGQADPGSE